MEVRCLIENMALHICYCLRRDLGAICTQNILQSTLSILLSESCRIQSGLFTFTKLWGVSEIPLYPLCIL